MITEKTSNESAFSNEFVQKTTVEALGENPIHATSSHREIDNASNEFT
jgi:hypothetical protein